MLFSMVFINMVASVDFPTFFPPHTTTRGFLPKKIKPMTGADPGFEKRGGAGGSGARPKDFFR